MMILWKWKKVPDESTLSCNGGHEPGAMSKLQGNFIRIYREQIVTLHLHRLMGCGHEGYSFECAPRIWSARGRQVTFALRQANELIKCGWNVRRPSRRQFAQHDSIER